MLLKKIIIASLLSTTTWLVTNVGNTAQAQEIRTLKDYLENCIPSGEEQNLLEECDRLKEAYEAQEEESFTNRERRRRQKEKEQEKDKSGGIGGYTGIVLGVYFPDIDEERPIFRGNDNDIDIETGLGSSIFVGIQFNRYIGTDLELSVLAGEIDSNLDDDQIYTMGGLFLNPRFTLPLTDKRNPLSLYLSPGIGVTQLAASVEDEVDDFDRTTTIEDDSRFTWQIKGGVSVPVSKKFSIIPQMRYASQTGDNAVDYFGLELGMKFDF